MERRTLAALVSAAVLLGVATEARAIVWDFSNPSGPNGSTAPYTASGVTISLSAFIDSATPGILWGKQGAGTQHGVGVCSTNTTGCAGEIQPGNFIRIDLGNQGLTNLRIQIGSVGEGESFSILTSGDSSLPGATPCVSNGTTEAPFALACSGGVKNFLFVEDGASGGVLLSGLQADLVANPEPATLLLVGSGLVALGGVGLGRLRRRKPIV